MTIAEKRKRRTDLIRALEFPVYDQNRDHNVIRARNAWRLREIEKYDKSILKAMLGGEK